MTCKTCGAGRGEYCGITAATVYRGGTCPKILTPAPAPERTLCQTFLRDGVVRE